ncbi:hypothetical protein UlMin_000954 [Ulmus minor]
MDNYFPCTHSSTTSTATTSSSRSCKEKKKRAGDKKSTKSVKLSTDPQSVAARERRHRISDRFKTLQSLVPGGAKMDTVSMLEEAIHYVKFLKTQIWLHQSMINSADDDYTCNSHLLPSSYDHQQQIFNGTSVQAQAPMAMAALPDYSCFPNHEHMGFDGYNVRY